MWRPCRRSSGRPSVALSLNEATITSSVWPSASSSRGELLLVGLHLRGRSLDVQVHDHTGEILDDREGLLRGWRSGSRGPRGALPRYGYAVRFEPGRDIRSRHEPIGVVELPQLARVRSAIAPVPSGGPVDGRRRADDQLLVGGRVHVELDPCRTGHERPTDREARRRRRLPGAALMRVARSHADPAKDSPDPLTVARPYAGRARWLRPAQVRVVTGAMSDCGLAPRCEITSAAHAPPSFAADTGSCPWVSP